MEVETIEKHITTNPLVQRGIPIVRGTRVPVYVVMDYVQDSYTPEEIVDNFPDLTIEDVKAAIAYHQRLQSSSV